MEERMDKITVTELRSKIYRVIDHVLDTGEPCEVIRDGRTVVIAPKIGAPQKTKPAKPNAGLFDKLSKSPKRKLWLGTEEELMTFSAWDEKAWDKQWDEWLKQ
jgi:antitoxin (DNA-binding transcriptional repressor) of toxin-antitoxin stability system